MSIAVPVGGDAGPEDRPSLPPQEQPSGSGPGGVAACLGSTKSQVRLLSSRLERQYDRHTNIGANVAVSRPNHVPDRYDWWHGEKVSAGWPVMIRDANNADLVQVQALVSAARPGKKFAPRLFGRLLHQHGYSLRLACRNHRNAVALCASRHTPDLTTILLCYSAPCFRGEGLEKALLDLATAEIPEAPSEFNVPHDDAEMQRILLSSGWSLIRGDESPDGTSPWRYRFTPAPCAARSGEVRGSPASGG